MAPPLPPSQKKPAGHEMGKLELEGHSCPGGHTTAVLLALPVGQ